MRPESLAYNSPEMKRPALLGCSKYNRTLFVIISFLTVLQMQRTTSNLSDMADKPKMDANFQKDYDDCVTIRRDRMEWTKRILTLASTQPTINNQLMYIDHRLCLRSLFRSEVEALISNCHCKARDWNAIRLLLPTEHARSECSNALRQLVSHTNFQDTVVLILPGVRAQVEGRMPSLYQNLEPGVHNNLLVRNCVLHLDARIYHNTLIQQTYIGSEAALIKCGTVSTSQSLEYGSLAVCVGAESGGGRKLLLEAESTMISVCEQLTRAAASKPQMVPTNCSKMNILCSGSIICDTPVIDGVFLYAQAVIEAATNVQNVILFPSAKIESSSTANNVMLQWNASISGHSTVSDAMLMEHSHAGPHSLISNSVLGPDVHVSAGEVHASVMGPSTNAHHQSLVIGVLWPLGRGNVGYGANVGSNHTGRLPDQEAVAGEGIFWGLSTAIKFPVDLSSAPYSVVAAGTQLNPQRVRMPFSLIVADEVNGGNSIIPGWILASSPYTLARSETKFATRRKAVHHNHYTGWKIIRHEVIEQCLWARQALTNVSVHKAMYTGDQDILGIGTAHLTERGRLSGIKAYGECICRFALQGLMEFVEQILDKGSEISEQMLTQELGSAAPLLISDISSVEWNSFPWQVDSAGVWYFKKSILVYEYPNTDTWVKWTVRLLQLYTKLETDYAESVFKCKHRDDLRGAEVIPGYSNFHTAAKEDNVIKEARESALLTREKVSCLLEQLDVIPESKL
jgi:hypothetical protein